MAINIKADFTCDNSYAIWLGSKTQVHTLIRQETNTSARGILSGEHFSFTAYENDFLYVLAWSDNLNRQGLIGMFNGGVRKQMGDIEWEVLPTNQDKGNLHFPTLPEINSHLATALPNDWKQPFVGPTNANTSSLYPELGSIANIDQDVNWVWYDSNNSGNPFSPGYNHQEFLIFRIPVKDLTACCSPCASDKYEQEKLLSEKAKSKTFVIKGTENNGKICKEPYSQDSCSLLDLPNIEPCFYLHWGDSKKDQIESHDDEIMYLTVCNPYYNLKFKGLNISKITISPASQVLPNGENDFTIVPDSLICFDTINGCTCSSIAISLLTRGVRPQNYKITVEYCIDSIEVVQFNKGKTSFDIKVINS